MTIEFVTVSGSGVITPSDNGQILSIYTIPAGRRAKILNCQFSAFSGAYSRSFDHSVKFIIGDMTMRWNSHQYNGSSDIHRYVGISDISCTSDMHGSYDFEERMAISRSGNLGNAVGNDNSHRFVEIPTFIGENIELKMEFKSNSSSNQDQGGYEYLITIAEEY